MQQRMCVSDKILVLGIWSLQFTVPLKRFLIATNNSHQESVTPFKFSFLFDRFLAEFLPRADIKYLYMLSFENFLKVYWGYGKK